MPSGLDDREKDGLLTRLGRRAARKPEDRRLISGMLLRYPAELGARSLSVAIELGEPVALAIEEALEGRDDPAADELAHRLEASLPWPTYTLRNVADLVMSRVTATASSGATGSECVRTGRIIDLALRRLDNGKHAEALELGRQAVELLRLGDGIEVGLLQVATALSNVLASLIADSDYGEALEVARSTRDILDAVPDTFRGPRHDVFWARVASSGAVARFHTGDVPGAVDDSRAAMAIFRRGIEEGATSFRVELSRTMTNLSLFLSHSDGMREAFRLSVGAVRIASDACDANPDGALPDLAFALEGLAARARSVGHPQWAAVAEGRALRIYEELAHASLAPYARDLARCLSNQAVYRLEAGMVGERVTMTRRAVGLLEYVERISPGSVDEELAIAHSTHAGALLEVEPPTATERATEAIAALRRAVEVIRRCRSPGSGLRLAAILANLTGLAEQVGDAGEAEAARCEALHTLARLSPEERHAIPGIADQVLSQLDPLE